MLALKWTYKRMLHKVYLKLHQYNWNQQHHRCFSSNILKNIGLQIKVYQLIQPLSRIENEWCSLPCKPVVLCCPNPRASEQFIPLLHFISTLSIPPPPHVPPRLLQMLTTCWIQPSCQKLKFETHVHRSMPINIGCNFNGWALWGSWHTRHVQTSNSPSPLHSIPLFVFLLSLHLHVVHHNYYDCEEHVRFNPSIET